MNIESICIDLKKTRDALTHAEATLIDTTNVVQCLQRDLEAQINALQKVNMREDDEDHRDQLKFSDLPEVKPAGDGFLILEDPDKNHGINYNYNECIHRGSGCDACADDGCTVRTHPAS